MNDQELQNIWKAYDQKLEEARILNMQSLALHLRNFEMLQMQKAKSKLNALMVVKILAIVAGAGWVVLISMFAFAAYMASAWVWFFSAGINVVLTIIAIQFYIRHVVFIKQINNSETVLEAQQKIALLQSTTLQTARIMFLTLPTYTTWHWDLMTNHSVWAWIIQGTITALFAWAGIWLFRNIHHKNVHKKWFTFLFGSAEWTSVTRAMEILHEIDAFKKEWNSHQPV